MDFLFVVVGASYSTVVGGFCVIKLLSGLLLRLLGSVRIYNPQRWSLSVQTQEKRKHTLQGSLLSAKVAVLILLAISAVAQTVGSGLAIENFLGVLLSLIGDIRVVDSGLVAANLVFSEFGRHGDC